jgi:hypothetical protein
LDFGFRAFLHFPQKKMFQKGVMRGKTRNAKAG